MKIALVSGALVAALAAGAIATPTFAQDYRSHDRGYASCGRDGAATGTVVGAVTGGFLGSQLAGRGDRTGGTILGALAGGLFGNAIGRSSSHNSYACDSHTQYRSGYGQDRYRQTDYGRSYYSDSNRYYGSGARNWSDSNRSYGYDRNEHNGRRSGGYDQGYGAYDSSGDYR